MFEKFGFLNSCEELNKAAAGFLNEGDVESLMKLAEENGIDKEDAQDYADEMMPEFATSMTAAMGRLKVIKSEIDKVKDVTHRSNQNMILIIIKNMLDDPEVAAGVMSSENIVAGTVKAMRDGNVRTGTDEDLKRIVKALIAGNVKEVTAEISTRYEKGVEQW